MNNNRLIVILEGCQRHDRVHQKDLFHIFYPYTLTVALRYAASMNEAREIVNDTFLKVFARIDRFDTKLPFKPWLNKITVYTAIDYYRKYQKHEQQTDSLEKIPETAASDDIFAKITADELLQLVQQLPPSYRTAINLYAIEGYEHHEIAELLHISVGASKSNLFKARARLRALMAQQENTTTKAQTQYGKF